MSKIGMELTERVIEVKCDLRWIIKRAATESIVMYTAVEMGLLSLLDTLAARSSAIDDPEVTKVLRILCLDNGKAQ